MLSITNNYPTVRLRIIISRLYRIVRVRKLYSINLERFIAVTFIWHRNKILYIPLNNFIISFIVCTNSFTKHINLEYTYNYRNQSNKSKRAPTENSYDLIINSEIVIFVILFHYKWK